ncbi:MAG: hypothetical protein AAF460_14160 [Pseudomonadota bacterium]
MATPPLHESIARRHTQKVLRDPSIRTPLTPAQQQQLDSALEAMLAAAQHAPYHKAAHAPLHCQGALTSRVPWRVYLIAQPTCWQLIDLIAARATAEPASTWARAQGSKIPSLLAAAAAVVQVNWCPTPDDDAAVSLNTANCEHIAASAAAVQNMLLTATDAGVANYWSTGGILREPTLQAALGMEPDGQPLASVFLSFPLEGDTVKPGAMRDVKGEISDWARTVTLDT